MSTREKCRNSILRALFERNLGFEEIIREIAKECGYSRGTTNKYLGELYREGYIQQEKGRGPRKYFLLKKGRTRAGKTLLAHKANIVMNAETPARIKTALKEMQRIIKFALETPDSNLDAFFSCIGEISQKHTGIYDVRNMDKRSIP
ncbi:MAG: winged helix-turn-helix transcriptional regulator [Candidatus Bathyarchaeota archaeon]|nr:MAG: winged helix-turn-helix transcriptional regulator [Candidatus Bathyarchaeota archaeon]